MTMSDHRSMGTKSQPSSRRNAGSRDWLCGAGLAGLLVCGAVGCQNQPTQTSEPLRPGVAGGANLEPGVTTHGTGTTGTGTTGSSTRTADGTQTAPLSGSANEIERTGGDDSSERTGSGGTSGRAGAGGHGGSAGHAGRGGSAGSHGH